MTKELKLNLIHDSLLKTVTCCGVPVIITGAEEEQREFIVDKLKESNSNCNPLTVEQCLQTLSVEEFMHNLPSTQQLIIHSEKFSPIIDRYIGNHIRVKLFFDKEQLAMHVIPVIRNYKEGVIEVELFQYEPTALVFKNGDKSEIKYKVEDIKNPTEIQINSFKQLIVGKELIDAKIKQLNLMGLKRSTPEMGATVFMIDLDSMELNAELEMTLEMMSRVCRVTGTYMVASITTNGLSLKSSIVEIFNKVYNDVLAVL